MVFDAFYDPNTPTHTHKQRQHQHQQITHTHILQQISLQFEIAATASLHAFFFGDIEEEYYLSSYPFTLAPHRVDAPSGKSPAVVALLEVQPQQYLVVCDIFHFLQEVVAIAAASR